MPSASFWSSQAGSKCADQRARAEEGGLVALAFLFGEADHLEAEGQAPARRGAARARRPSARRCPAGRRTCRRCARCRSGCRSAARLAPAGRCRGRRRPRCRPRRSPTSSKPQSSRIQCRDLRGAGAVRVGQVGDGELAVLGVARVAVRGQLLRPVPDQVAQRRARRRTCRSAGSRRCGGCCAGTRPARSRDGCASRRSKVSMICRRVQPGAARAAHRQDEREAELRVVVGVELLDARELFRRAVGQAGLALLVGRFGGQRLARPSPCRRVRGGRGSAPAARRGRRRARPSTIACFRCASERKGRCGQRALGDPGRMLVAAVEQRGGLGRRRGVESVRG